MGFLDNLFNMADKRELKGFEKIADQIINDYIEVNPQFKETKVTINKYLGTYDGAVVLMIRSDAQLFQNVLTTELISGISFNYKNSQKILIWKGWVNLSKNIGHIFIEFYRKW